MSERGMKKWVPYKSLDSQDAFLFNMKKKKERIEKPFLMEDEAKRINDILLSYHGQEVVIKIYEDGYINKIEGVIKKIDITSSYLVIEENRYPLRNLVGLEEKT